MSAKEAIPQRGVLAIVAKALEMVIGVMSSAVDVALKDLGHPVVAVMDAHGPAVDAHIHEQVEVLVEREQEDENVIGQALQITIQGVEGMRGKRGHSNPLVMWLVHILVEEFDIVQSSMNKVDAHVCELDKSDLKNAKLVTIQHSPVKSKKRTRLNARYP